MFLAAGSPARAGKDWPSFHNGGDTSVELQNLPLEWSPHEGIAWSLELPGYGQSAPVVWQNQVFITAVAGDNKERNFVLSFDGRTGRCLWRQEFPATVRMKNSYMVSRAAPTPLVNATGVYAMFESGDLHALSHEGQPFWQRTFFDGAERAFQNGHGYGASPAQTETSVVLLIDHRGPSCLMALSKQTGELVWKTERSSRASWTSPHVMQVGGSTQVIVSSNGTVDGYDAETGRQLWSHEGLSGNLIPSATIHGDRVYVGASIGQRDSNAVAAAVSNCCLQITPRQAPGYRLLWQADKAVCDYASPLAHRDHVYYLNKVGVLYCLNAATGQQRYVKRIGTPCWAQPIAAGERLYFFGKNGVTKVIGAGRISSNSRPTVSGAATLRRCRSGPMAMNPRMNPTRVHRTRAGNTSIRLCTEWLPSREHSTSGWERICSALKARSAGSPFETCARSRRSITHRRLEAARSMCG
ncbi:MAG: PQQ-binding-like beta-propeller repeat protein [Planctomycetes bacterium]|nr:PQQ-binding-like beta-propeller repeat protein [Planctomycetota bacterium]